MHDFFLSLFLPAFFSFLFFFWFCFHAKLDYFYGAIYSTKFTTTMLLGGQVRPFPWRQTSGQMSDVAPIQWRFVDVFGGYSSFHSYGYYNSWKSKENYNPRYKLEILQKNVFYLILTSLESHSPCRSKAISIEAISCKIQVLKNVRYIYWHVVIQILTLVLIQSTNYQRDSTVVDDNLFPGRSNSRWSSFV